jgi:hypothetical protein
MLNAAITANGKIPGSNFRTIPSSWSAQIVDEAVLCDVAAAAGPHQVVIFSKCTPEI